MKKVINKTYFLPLLICFINYDYFPVIALLYILIIYKLNLDVNIKTSISKTIFSSFLILRFISSFNLILANFWLTLSQKNYALNGRFIDLQGVFMSINCTPDLDQQQVKIFGAEEVMTCPYSVSYGPLLEILKFNLNPWFATWITALIVLILINLFYLSVVKNFDNRETYIATLFFLSPPLNFVLERMNLDVIIIASIYLALKFIKSEHIKNLVITVLALVKYYPIVILLANIIYKKASNETKKIIIDISYIIGFLVLMFLSINDGSITLNQPVRPFRSDRTFGVLSEALNLEHAFGYSYKSFYFVLMLIIFYIILITKQNFQYSNLFNDHINHSFLFLFLSLAMFSNYDYRAFFILIIFTDIFKSKNKILFYSYTIFIFSSPGLLYAYKDLFKLVEDYFFVYLDIPFYFFVASLLMEYYSYIKRNILK